MSATAMPLPLELTKPITLAADLDTQLRESYGVGHYDPKMQVTMWLSGGTTSTNNSNSISAGIVVDAQVDVAIDDSFNN